MKVAGKKRKTVDPDTAVANQLKDLFRSGEVESDILSWSEVSTKVQKPIKWCHQIIAEAVRMGDLHDVSIRWLVFPTAELLEESRDVWNCNKTQQTKVVERNLTDMLLDFARQRGNDKNMHVLDPKKILEHLMDTYSKQHISSVRHCDEVLVLKYEIDSYRSRIAQLQMENEQLSFFQENNLNFITTDLTGEEASVEKALEIMMGSTDNQQEQ